MNYLQIIRLIVQLLPVLIDAIKAVETAIPQPGQGSQKLAAVRTILEAAWQGASDTAGAFEMLWPVLERTITAIVAAFNAAGIFRNAPANAASGTS